MAVPVPSLIVSFSVALIISTALVPLVRSLALQKGLVDAPGERKIHQTPIPRVGGVAIFVAFALTCLFVSLLFPDSFRHSGLLGLLSGSVGMFALGLVDDVLNLSPYVKLVGQALAISVAFAGGVQIVGLDLPGSYYLVLNGLAFPITLLWMMAISNALNFIDGVDGLASGITTISALTMVVVAVFTHQYAAAVIAAMLAGANMGFLVFNFHPARIFMGDGGALFSGFMLAGLAVTGVLKTPVVVMLLPILVLSVPIMDITYSTIRRLLAGQSPFIADANHIHHRLLKAGFTQIRTATLLYGIAVLSGLIATMYINSVPVYVGVILMAMVIFVILNRFLRPLFS
jgi:UDP-GlcNAc:undecaprenyl-phosphate/decaprenyl-phosphate GlcNAc-1-phosphate transferase